METVHTDLVPGTVQVINAGQFRIRVKYMTCVMHTSCGVNIEITDTDTEKVTSVTV